MPRKFEIGNVLDRTLKAYQANIGPLIAGSAIVLGVTLIPIVMMIAAIGIDGFTSQAGDDIHLSGGEVALLIVAVTLLVFVAWFSALWLAAFSARVVGSIWGRIPRETFGERLRRSFDRFGTLIVMSFVATLGLIVGFVLLIVPMFILLTIWALVIPVIVFEPEVGAMGALGRSREIVRGNGWEVFATFLVIYLIVGVVSAIAGIIPFVGNVASALLAPVPYLASTIIYFLLTQGPPPGEPAPVAYYAPVQPGVAVPPQHPQAGQPPQAPQAPQAPSWTPQPGQGGQPDGGDQPPPPPPA